MVALALFTVHRRADLQWVRVDGAGIDQWPDRVNPSHPLVLVNDGSADMKSNTVKSLAAAKWETADHARSALMTRS